MGGESGKEGRDKKTLVLEVLAAVAAVAVLVQGLFWSADVNPILHHAVQIFFSVLMIVSAVLLIVKAAKAKKQG